MQKKFSKSNTITATKLPNGKTQYSVNLGTVLYNNRFLDLNNLIIPFEDRQFFILPEESNKYAVINIYYDAENGVFYFDRVLISNTYISSVTTETIPNMLPIGQFVLQEQDGGFVVKNYNEYSRMATFSITDTFTPGDTGSKGYQGLTGEVGDSGLTGDIGITGFRGITGVQGLTGVGKKGLDGAQGETGVYPDGELLLHFKFKTLHRKQTDYSVYERDIYYEETGAYNNVGEPLSGYTGIEGIEDNAHSVYYGGGISQYRRYEYLDFGHYTGTVCAWVKMTQRPKPGFTYEVVSNDGLDVKFTDTSKGHPTSWKWWFEYDGTVDGKTGGTTSTDQNPLYHFPSAGEYIVKLRAENSGGYNEYSEFITIS